MKKALVLIADGTEEMEVVTVIDVLRRAQIDVTVAGLTGEPITASRGVRLIPDRGIEGLSATQFDALVLPGGNGGAEAFEGDQRVLALIREASQNGVLLGAICAAPRVLYAAGVLKGKVVTSYPGALTEESADYTYETHPVVEDGALITSRGPGTALDFALKLVERLKGYSARRSVEAPLLRP